MVVIYLMVGVGVKLANASGDEENDCNTTQPPSDGNACSETRHDEEDRTYDVADDG